MLLGGRGDLVVKIIKWCEENHELVGILIDVVKGAAGVGIGIVFGRILERRKQQIGREWTLYPELLNGIERLRRCLNEKGRLSENCKSIYMLEYFQSIQSQCGLPNESRFTENEINHYKEIVGEMKEHYKKGDVNLQPRYANAKKWKMSWQVMDAFFDFISKATVDDEEEKISEITWTQESSAPHVLKLKKLNEAIDYISEALDIYSKNIFQWVAYKIKHLLKKM